MDLVLRTFAGRAAWYKDQGKTYHHLSKDITKVGAIVFNRNSDALISLPTFSYGFIVFLVELSVLPHQKDSLRESHCCSEEHESSTDGHALDVPWALRHRVEPCTQNWATLSDDIDNDKSSATAAIATLVV